MSMSTSNAAATLTAAQIDQLVIQPIATESIAFQVTRVVQIASHDLRVPRVTSDPAAQWVAEGALIPADDASVSEVLVTPAKVAGLTIVSRELATDSSPAATEIVGLGLARSLAARIDEALFAKYTGTGTRIRPKGLEDLAGADAPTAVSAGTAWKSADPFTEAIYAAEGVGASVGAFVVGPTDGLALSTLKTATGSNVALLQPDATLPGRRVISGVPMFVSRYVTPGTVWGIPAGRIVTALRQGTTVDIDPSAYFSSDSYGVRATARIGFAFPHPAAIVKISLSV